MNEAPMTRRDVVALFAYSILVANACARLIYWATITILTRSVLFTPSGLSLVNNWQRALVVVVAQLVLTPFVSLAALGATGRDAHTPLRRRDIRCLVLPCAGIVLLALVFAQLPVTALDWWEIARRGSPVPFTRYVIADFVVLSLGFALAFFPTIFAALRHRWREGS